MRLTLQKKEEQKVLVTSACEFYQFIWSRDFEKSLFTLYLNNLSRIDFHGGENVNKVNPILISPKYYFLAFCHFFFFVVGVAFANIFSIDFRSLPTFEGKRGLWTSVVF